MARNMWNSRMKTMVVDFVCGLLVGVVCFSRSGGGRDPSFAEWFCCVGITGLLFALFGRRLWRFLARAHRKGNIFTRCERRDKPKGSD
jgi:hypothetical protein